MLTTKLKALSLLLFIFVAVIGVVAIILTDSSAQRAELFEILQDEAHAVGQMVNDHLFWRQGLTEATLTGTRFGGSLDPAGCSLGKWLNSENIKNITDEEILSLINEIHAPHDFIHREAHTLWILSLEDARRHLFDVVLPETQKVTAILLQIESRYLELVHNEIEVIVANGRTMLILVIIFVIFIAGAGILLYVALNRMIKPIRVITDDAIKIADGNFDIVHVSSSSDEIGLLSKSFDKIIVSLGNLNEDITRMHEQQQQGNYHHLIDSDAYDGAYAVIVAHINELIKSLINAKNDADEANRTKSVFLSTMSHEVRTPMNAILGITEILIRDENTPLNIIDGLTRIHSSGDLLINIINDILDLSRIEAGKMELNSSKYETASLINDTVMLNVMRTGSKPIEFKLLVDENIPLFLLGDELRIKQILNNLLSNAFKYTKEGEVKLSFGIEKEQNKLILVFEIKDTGIGMTKEQVGAMFDEFSRFNRDDSQITEGTGLGMSIVKNLIKLMDGDITVESEPDKGTSVTVRLPQRCINPEIIGKELSQDLCNFKQYGTRQIQKASMIFEEMSYGSVLVVDDVESNSFVAKGLMIPYGLNIETASSGFEVIDKIKSGKSYDVIFMDHMMPKMDGIEATGILRDMGYTEPIVALTANAVAGKKDMFLANGFDDFISKPIDIRHLNNVLKKFVRDRRTPEEIKNSKIQAEKRANSKLSPQFMDFFLSDMKRIINVLEKTAFNNDASIKMHTVNVHALKSILTNVGEKELSELAAALEKAGNKGNIGFIMSETPVLIAKVKEVVERLSLQKSEGPKKADGDLEVLRSEMAEIQKACRDFDKKTAKDIINRLREFSWPLDLNEQLYEMAENLMCGDFDIVSSAAGELIKKYKKL